MATTLDRKEAGTHGVRRIARKEVRKALQDLRGRTDDERVHDARKRLKRVRAALRLLRPALRPRKWKHENARYRDAARPLRGLRDSKALLDAVDDFVADVGGAAASTRGLGALRRALRVRNRKARARARRSLAEARRLLKTAPKRIDRWPVGRHGWSVLGKGLRRIYRSGRDAFAKAKRDRSAANFHEWRKQVKYLGNDLKMLESVRPAVFHGLIGETDALGDLLGESHDLSALADEVRAAVRISAQDKRRLNALIADRRKQLADEALAAGERIYTEKPKMLTRSLGSLWRDWKAG